MKPPSFEKDHTKMDIPFIEHRASHRFGNVMIMKVDIRMKQPNSGDYVDVATLHSIEHLLAQHLYKYHPEKIIDVSPMGCHTGLYLSYLKTAKEEPLFIAGSMLWASQQEVSPKPTEKNCGNYLSHNFDEARRLLREMADRIEKEPNREYLAR